MENLYMPINDLIFAPINAVKEADILLSNGILKQIATFSENFSEEKNNSSELPTMKLKNIKFLYEKIKSEETREIIETMGLTVPAASIIPLSALQINGASVDFNIEVKSDMDENEEIVLYGKTAAANIRKTDYMPKMHFKMKTEAISVPEGVSRLIDVLNINQIPSVEQKIYVDRDGMPYENQSLHIKRNKIKNEINNIAIMIEKINKAIAELEKVSDFGGYTEYTGISDEHDKFFEHLNKYKMLKTAKENELLKTEIEILEEKIGNGQ